MFEHQKLLCVFGATVAAARAALSSPAFVTARLTTEVMLTKYPSVRYRRLADNQSILYHFSVFL
jgi:hypothetical protein